MKKNVLLILILVTSSIYAQQRDFYQRLSDAAVDIIDRTIRYDAAYTTIPYPNGDVAADRGVCTDVVIRAYRKVGIDLQKEVHEDMKANFSLYPSRRRWGARTTDRSIDHRRVPNLQVFFSRKGEELSITQDKSDYKPGDIVTWDLDDGRPHIGIVIHKQANRSKNPLIVHNIGGGQVAEDVLFKYKITGHYKYRK